jgi:glutamyl-tRNA synthetase
MNGLYIRALSVDELTARLEAFTGRTGLREAVAISQEKIATLADFWPLAGALIDGPVADDAKAREQWLGVEGRAALSDVRAVLAGLEPFELESIDAALRGVVAARETKPKQVFQPVRVALTGRTISPGVFEMISVLGREETLRRLDAALV